MLYESSRIKTIAVELSLLRLVESPRDNIGLAIAKLRRIIPRQRMKSKNLLFGFDCLMDRFFDCSNKNIAEKFWYFFWRRAIRWINTGAAIPKIPSKYNGDKKLKLMALNVFLGFFFAVNNRVGLVPVELMFEGIYNRCPAWCNENGSIRLDLESTSDRFL